jgi:broad specificity phosphatase PhoE
MTTVVFVRHGESNSNVYLHENPKDPELSSKINALGDPDLSELGKKQAAVVGKFLHKCLINQKVRVLTSLFSRTKQTSDPFIKIFKKHIISVNHLEVLNEYTKQEKNLTEKHLEKGISHHDNWKHFTEKIIEFVDLLENLCQCNESTIIVFGHSLFISATISYLGSSKQMMPLKNQLTFRLPNCSITTTEYSQGSWRIFNVGSIAHLSKEIVTGTECSFGTTLK